MIQFYSFQGRCCKFRLATKNFFVSKQYSRLDDADPEIENLIQFITGLQSIPPLGFPDDISILFRHGFINADCVSLQSVHAITAVHPHPYYTRRQNAGISAESSKGRLLLWPVVKQ